MADKTRREYETPKVYHDAPLRKDDKAHFYFDEFALTLARLIASPETRTPLTICASGAWGSGKTTLLQRVKRLLDEAGDHSDASKVAFRNRKAEPFRVCRTVWFDAWKYADEDQLLVALIRVILTTMAQGNLGEKIWSKVLDKNHPRYDVLATFLGFFKFKTDVAEVGFDIEKYKHETPFAQNTAFLDFFDAAFEELLARWVHGTGDLTKINEKAGALVVFIDDLDRCLSTKIIQVLEAIKLFLDKPGCVFVLGADINVIRDAVQDHYQSVKITGQSASDYLEKIIQLRFELPPILDETMGDYIEAEMEVDEEVRKHWKLIVTGAEINPRKVKTFVNDLNLQWAMLKNIGQAQGINRDDFTQWQVLMRVAPRNFIKRVNELDDIELRHKFILDAIKWASDDQEVAGSFQDYESALRLKRVLRVIQFTDRFMPQVLDAFVHMMAPPPWLIPASAIDDFVNWAVESAASEEEEDAKIMAKDISDTLAVESSAMRKLTENLNIRSKDKGARNVESGLPPGAKLFGGIPFVRVPAGKFVMGSREDNALARDDEKPQHTIDIPYDYWIARYPVTNIEFAKFVATTQREVKLPEGNAYADHPVVNISWYDAMEYCKWLNQTLRNEIDDLIVRLPTEAEWEKAARGEYGNEWPWGNEFDPAKCNSREGGKGDTTPVGTYSPQGDSPYGAADMAGDVWEWCHSLFKPYPYRAEDGREDESTKDVRVLRGGSFGSSLGSARVAFRFKPNTGIRYYLVGLRVAVAPRLS